RVVGLLHGTDDAEPGVVHQHVDPAEALDGRAHAGLDVLAAGDVEAHDQHVVALRQIGDRLRRPHRENHALPAAQHLFGELPAEARRRARDEPDLLLALVRHGVTSWSRSYVAPPLRKTASNWIG